MVEIRKAVVPAAGLGTRMLPATKAVPKELLPVIDRPALHYVVKEAVAAGIEHVIIVTARGKEAVARYFTPDRALENATRDPAVRTALAELRSLHDAARFEYVTQERQLGLGDAVLTARGAVGEEPFAVLLPDTLLYGEIPGIKQLADLHDRRRAPALAVSPVDRDQLTAVGVIAPDDLGHGEYRVRGVVEKPPVDRAPSNLAIVGRYVLTPDVFDALEQVSPGPLGELQLTDGIAWLLERRPVFAKRLDATWYDTGTPLGLLRTSLELALRRSDTAPYVRGLIRSLGKTR